MNQEAPPSQTSEDDEEDAEERLDCVHDIHSQRRGGGGRVSVLSQSHSSNNGDSFENVYGDSQQQSQFQLDVTVDAEGAQVTERRYSNSEQAQDEVETDHLETERKPQVPADESNSGLEQVKKASTATSNLVKLTPNKQLKVSSEFNQRRNSDRSEEFIEINMQSHKNSHQGMSQSKSKRGAIQQQQRQDSD